MRVREDRIKRASGQEGIYGMVEKTDFVMIAAVEDDHIWLVEQYRYPLKGRYWELPQGAREGSDADPSAVAAGELREETGLIAENWYYAGFQYLAPGFSCQRFHSYLATGLQQSTRMPDPEEEGLICKPVPLTEFREMIFDGIIRDSNTIATFGMLNLKGLI